MGRPALPPEAKRSEEIKLRLTPAGRRSLERMATFRRHPNPSDYLLALLRRESDQAGCRGHRTGDECGRCGVGP